MLVQRSFFPTRRDRDQKQHIMVQRRVVPGFHTKQNVGAKQERPQKKHMLMQREVVPRRNI